MPRSQKTNISSALLLGFLGCTAFVMPNTSAYAAQTVSAKSSWAVSRVASITQGNYCTMAQKYDNNAILSIARSVAGEYSLALDFQSPTFAENAQEAITLKAGNSKAEKFNVSPQSAQVAVISLGRDEAFLKALESSEKLSVSFAGKDMSFSTDRFKEGRTELMTCLSGLRGSAPIAAQPSSDAAPPVAKDQAQSTNIASNSPSVEGLLAARPKPSMGAEPISSLETSAPVIKVDALPVEASEIKQEAPKTASHVPSTSNTALERQIQDLTVENAQLKRALSESRQSFENQISQAQGAAVSEVKEKLSSAQNENTQLKSKVVALEKNIEALKTQNGATNKSSAEIESAKAEASRLSQQLETLKAENTTLKNQLDIASAASATAASGSQNDTSAFEQKIASLQKENNDLKTTISQLEQQTAKMSQMMESANGDENANKEMQEKLAKLSSENTSLKAQVSELAVAVQQPKTVTPAENDNELRKEIRTLQTQIEKLNGEKSALQTSFEKLQREGEQSQIKSAGGSWDLEQATRRYQESQREIRRLGALLEDERLKCTAEKKEIEAMLFDPSIADSAQISKLNSLEDQLKEKEGQISALQDQLAQASSKPSPEQEQQIAILKNQMSEVEQKLNSTVSEKEAIQAKLSGMQQTSSVQSEALNDKIAALEASLEQKSATISGLESQVLSLKQQSSMTVADKKQQEQMAQSAQEAISKKNAELTVLKAQLDERNAKLASLESRLKAAEGMTQQIQAAKASEKSNDALIATLKEDLVGKSKELGESEARIIQLQGQVAQLQSRMSASQENGSATVVNLQSQITKDQARIVQLEAQIKAIQQQNNKAMAQQAAYVAPSVGTESTTAIPVSTKYVEPSFPSASEYKSFLLKAGVPVVGGISEVAAGAKSANYKAYSWKTQSLYGSVEMRRVASAAAFNDIISQYLERAKSRCQGEFAAVPAQTKARNADVSKSYEIACVGQGASSSASVLFTYGKGIASTFAHEGRAEAMDLAIDARDRVAGNFR